MDLVLYNTSGVKEYRGNYYLSLYPLAVEQSRFGLRGAKMNCEICPLRVDCISQEDCAVAHVMDMVVGDYLEVYMKGFDEDEPNEVQARAFLKGCKAICKVFGIPCPLILNEDQWSFS